MLNLFNAPSVPLPKLLDILQILVLQVLSKVRELFRERAVVHLRRRGRRRGRRRQAIRDRQQIPVVMIVGCGGDFGRFEGHRGRSLLARRWLGWKDERRVGCHRHGRSRLGFELEGFKVALLAYWGGHDSGAGTEENGEGSRTRCKQGYRRVLGRFWTLKNGAGRGKMWNQVKSSTEVLLRTRDADNFFRALSRYRMRQVRAACHQGRRHRNRVLAGEPISDEIIYPARRYYKLQPFKSRRGNRWRRHCTDPNGRVGC
jgi:hypothetical protein